MNHKNNLAVLLNQELLNTTEKFTKKCPKADADVILGAGNLYITSFLINAPTKQAAKESLESCIKIMRNLIEVTPDNFFNGGIARHFNQN